MIRHIVSLQLVAIDTAERDEHARQVQDRLCSLHDVSAGIISLDVYTDLGAVPGHWPLVLIGDYVDAHALQEYQEHPRHREVVEWMNSGIVSDRVVVDFVTA